MEHRFFLFKAWFFTTVNIIIGPKQYRHWYLMVRVVFVRQSSGDTKSEGLGNDVPEAEAFLLILN